MCGVEGRRFIVLLKYHPIRFIKMSGMITRLPTKRISAISQWKHSPEFYPQDGGDSQLALILRHRHPMYNADLRRKSGIFARSVRVKLLLNGYARLQCRRCCRALRRSTLPCPAYESSFWPSNWAYETSRKPCYRSDTRRLLNWPTETASRIFYD